MALRDDLKLWVAKQIWQTVDNRTGDVISPDRWNELFNLLIEQGDDTTNTLNDLRDMLYETLYDDINGAEHLTISDASITADNVKNALIELKTELSEQAAADSDLEQSIQNIINNEVAVNTITNELLAHDVKVGSLAALDTTNKDNITNAINEVNASLEILEALLSDYSTLVSDVTTMRDTTLNPSSLYNGLEIDDDGKISLLKPPYFLGEVIEDITFSETGTFNTDQDIELDFPFEYGRMLVVLLRPNGSDFSRWILTFIEMRSGDAIMSIGTDYNGNVLCQRQDLLGCLVNSTSSFGCGVVSPSTTKTYFFGVEYDKDYGSWGSLRFNFSGTEVPIDFDFEVTFMGVV